MLLVRQRQEIRERAAQPGEIVSNIVDFTLEDLTVPAGTTVTWVNMDNDAHTTTSGVPDNPTGLWDSPLLNKGGSFSYTFNEVGVYQYFCRPHSSFMRATVTVLGDTATPTPTPREGKAGDVNGDGVVNIVDIGIIIDFFGTSPPEDARADLNKDNVVNIVDIGIVIDNYGL